jgi:hypothetical protein
MRAAAGSRAAKSVNGTANPSGISPRSASRAIQAPARPARLALIIPLLVFNTSDSLPSAAQCERKEALIDPRKVAPISALTKLGTALIGWSSYLGAK